MNLLDLVVASSSASNYSPTFPGGILAWIICNANKKKQIGGWLLFYYWGVYSGILVTVLMFFGEFQNYVPEAFDDPHKYHMMLLSVLPVFAILTAQCIVATILLSVRTWDLIRVLRGVLAVGIAVAIVSISIDSQSFPDGLVFDVLDIASFTIWLWYFSRSERVKHVFRDHDWEQTSASWYPPKHAALTQ